MPQRNVASNFTFEQQRVEINNLAQDFWTQKGTVDTAAPTYLKHDGSNNFTGQTLNVPNAFTINANSGSGTVTISGNLDVTGTTTTVSTANLEVTDKNILIGKGSSSDAQADGAGITIDSATDITFNFVDANDALVSSIGLEATDHLKAARGQFTGATTPSTGSGVEVNAPDANTGQIIAFNRGGTPQYNELRIKGSSVGIYGGTSNALVGTFNSTGLSVTGTITSSDDVIITGANKSFTSESSSTDDYVRMYAGSGTGRWDIYGNGANLRFSDNASAGSVVFDRNVDANGGITGDLTGTASKVNITSESGSGTAFRVIFSSVNSGSADLYSDNSDGMTYKPSDGTLSVQKLEGTIVTAAQTSITSVGTLTSLSVGGDVTVSHSGLAVNIFESTDDHSRLRIKASDASLSQLEFADADADAGEIRYDHANDRMTIHVGNNVEQLRIESSGDVLPAGDNTQDFGSSTKRWANVYTADAHFNNIGTGGNEVDGSEGHWTMQEGESDFFLINRRSGKKYKFMLQEVN